MSSAHRLPPGHCGNRLPDALPAAEYERLAAQMERVTLTSKQLLTVEDHPFEHAWFPLNRVVSMLARTGADTFVEVATIGREGTGSH